MLTCTVAGCKRDMTPADARRESVPFGLFSDADVAAIDKLADTLVPGSAQAGLAHYLDHQLTTLPENNMLMIKYLGVPAPYDGFYHGGLTAAAAAAKSIFATDIADLSEDQASTLVSNMASGEIDNWEGPPAGFFYFVLRSDAVDVSYGTKAGFEALAIPYNAHIEPPSRWGE